MAPILFALLLAGPITPDATTTHRGRCQSEELALVDLENSGLSVPVVGVDPYTLIDTFRMRRSGKRMHKAIDIMAPLGSPIVAFDDGVIVGIRDNRLGGKVIEQLDVTGCMGFYYAHLDHYAPDLVKGMIVKRGDVLGFVGTTGNAPASAPHLHLGVYHLADQPGVFSWKTPLNPYPILVTRDAS